MTRNPSSAQGAVFHGTLRIFLAEAILLPTGLITAAYLTRKFGPEDYGLFTLAATIISWIEWTIASIFARATFKFTAEAEDWRPLGTKVVHLHLILGCLSAVLIWIAAGLVAEWLNEPMLKPCLQWFAIDIPFFCVAQANRNLLVGLGQFNARAVISGVRWLVRLFAMIALVEMGLSIQGAIWGSIVASLIELIVSRLYVRAPLLRRSDFPTRKLWGYAVPLFLFAFSMRIYEKLDLIMLKPMGATMADTGLYGAAQNLSLVVQLFSLSFGPLLLSSLSGLLHRGEESEAKELGQNSLRVVLALFPFAAMTAGSSDEIVTFIFGSMFRETAPILARLMFSGVFLVGISVATAILTSLGRPALTFALAGPMVAVSLVGYVLVIPVKGAVGAASVNLAIAFLGAIFSLIALKRVWGIAPGAGSVLRVALISGIAYSVAGWWSTPGVYVLMKLLGMSVMIGLIFLISGEFSLRELNLSRSNADTQER